MLRLYMVGAGWWCCLWLWGTAVMRVDLGALVIGPLGSLMLYFGSVRGLNQAGVCKCKSQRPKRGGVWVFFFLLVWAFLNCFFFCDFWVLKSSVNKQGSSAQSVRLQSILLVCVVIPASNDCATRKHPSTSVVYCACATNAQAVPQWKSCFKCAQQDSPPESGSSGKYS